ncbi:MAG TPA: tRNA (cytidine(34)-2'-O)-methyltransferase [Polyangiaceae bacterium]|nr:tRNA (cytidine(34)-2'-O)-methyltransferase [Polyangiaceae bacterium]
MLPSPAPPRLRAREVARPFHILLVEPEIPPNTGNVARLCVANGCPLHLVGRLGFRIDAHAVRRAGLDYWEHIELHQHRTLIEAEQTLAGSSGAGTRPPRSFLFSGHADQSYLDVDFQQGDRLVFGRESVGLPHELLESRPDDVVGIPLLGPVRSLNLANAVAIALYEGLRRLGLLAGAKRRDVAQRAGD